MSIRILTVSVLALGLLAPVGAMAETSNNCSQDQLNKGDYIDCRDTDTNTSVQFGFAAQGVESVGRGPVGDFIDETPAESNDRSSN